MQIGLHALTHTRYQDNTHNNAEVAYTYRLLVVNPHDQKFWLKPKDTSGFADSPREAATIHSQMLPPTHRRTPIGGMTH